MNRLFLRRLLQFGLTVMSLTTLVCAVILICLRTYVALGILLGIVAVLVVLMLSLARKLAKHMSDAVSEPLNKLYFEQAEQQCPYPELQPMMRRVADLHRHMVAQRADLSDQRNRLDVLVENMREGLILMDADGRILIHNSAALHLLGHSSVLPEQLSVYDLHESADFRSLINDALSGTHGETTVYSEEHACQLIAGPVSHSVQQSEHPDGAVLVLLDVTEREKRDVLRREFTSNVSHELKTPLTSIYGIADMLASGLVRPEDISGFAGRIRDESSRMIALIEDIIRLSRLDDESFSEELVPIDLYQIAGNVLLQLRPAAEARNLTMTLHGGSAPVMGVPVIVEEMLYNLCDNAIKYNVEGGTVRMTVRQTAQQAMVTVADTGIGVPPADRDRIFERFYRVDKSHSRKIGGTGLGLSIVKHGAAFHNATIELKSQTGKGTKITLCFPKADAE